MEIREDNYLKNIAEDDGVYMVSAEVFGKGIEISYNPYKMETYFYHIWRNGMICTVRLHGMIHTRTATRLMWGIGVLRVLHLRRFLTWTWNFGGGF